MEEKERTMSSVKKNKIALGLQLLIALFLGGVAGYFLPQFASFYQFLGQAFIRLISMLIIPLVLPLVVVAVAEVLGKNHFQKLLGKTFLYFFAVTTGITALFVFASYYLGFGQGVNIGQEGASLEGIATGVKIDEFFLNFIPSNLFKALTDGALLPILIFAIFLGYGVGQLEQEKKEAFLSGIKIWIAAIYKILDAVILLSPVGVFGFIAKDVATTGVDKLVGLGQFVLGMYLGYGVLALVIFPVIAILYKVNYVKLIKSIGDLVTLAFVSGGSSVVLPPLLKRLKKEINKDSNESHYHLEEYDDELSRLNQERNEVIAQKQNALHSFETVNQNIIRDEMENTEKERLTTLKEQWQQASQERNSLEGKAQELQISITQKFEQFIGKKHLNEEDLHRMIQFLQEGQCKSLTEAVLKLEAPEVEPVLAPAGESDSE